MKIIAINGSPRKKWNTATLLEKALEGAATQDAETELVHLYDLNYKGCISCFACKLVRGKSYGHCNPNDDLKPLLQKIEETDALILGSPIYFGNETGEMRSFLERLLFQYLTYDKSHSSLRKKEIPTGIIYAMNVPEKMLEEINYKRVLGTIESSIKWILSSKDVLPLYVTNTYQLDDYSKYNVTMFSGEQKAKRRAEEFPIDYQKAFEMGQQLIQKLK